MRKEGVIRAGQKLTAKQVRDQATGLARSLHNEKTEYIRQNLKVTEEQIAAKAPEDRYSFYPSSYRYGVPRKVRQAIYICELIRRGASV